MTALEYDGERMVPEKADLHTFWEHIYRYRFAARFARGKRVLDIACGEGYGAAALSKSGARSVVGVDISKEAVDHARQKYGVDARYGNAEEIPLADESIDLIVSYETLEHVPNAALFLDECRRVLAPGGMLIVSTPNKLIYSDAIGRTNPFHCSELSRDEFERLLRPRFSSVKLYTQRPMRASGWSVRWLAAKYSPIYRIRGPRGIRNALRRKLGVPFEGEVPLAARSAATDLILSRDLPGTGCLNPYALRKPAWWMDENPLFFIGVAIRSHQG